MSKKSSAFRSFFKLLPWFRQSIYSDKSLEIAEETYLIREVRNKDIKDLLAVERDAFNDLPWDRGAFLFELNAPYPRLYLLIQLGEEVIGFIGCRFKDGNGHLTNLAVRQQYQGKGLGSLLLREVKNYSRKFGYHSLSLEVRLSNMDAQRLYRQFGFHSRSIKKEYYTKGNEDALDMICILGEKSDDSEKKPFYRQ